MTQSTSETVASTTEVVLPEIGLHEDVPASTYHAWPLASSSALGKLKRSPAHMMADRKFPEKPTEAKILGNAIHKLTLEPGRFSECYLVAGQCTAPKAKGSPERCPHSGKVLRDGEWFCGTHDKGAPPVLPVLSDFQHQICKAARESVFAHPKARQLLEAAGQFEVSAVWEDLATGVVCKGRPDHLVPSRSTIVDVKSTEDASRPAFERSIFNFGYHRQAAHYIDGLASLDRVYENFGFICVEKKYPYAVAVYGLDDDVVDAGRQELRELLTLYKKCEDAGRWPAYSEKTQRIGLPAYAWNQLYTYEEE